MNSAIAADYQKSERSDSDLSIDFDAEKMEQLFGDDSGPLRHSERESMGVEDMGGLVLIDPSSVDSGWPMIIDQATKKIGGNKLIDPASDTEFKDNCDNFKGLIQMKSSHEPQILIVEDNIYSACALISILDQYSLPYKLVLSGKCAVNAFMFRHTEESLTLPYKLIVMDYMLPGMNGLEASRQIIKFANQRNIE